MAAGTVPVSELLARLMLCSPTDILISMCTSISLSHCTVMSCLHSIHAASVASNTAGRWILCHANLNCREVLEYCMPPHVHLDALLHSLAHLYCIACDIVGYAPCETVNRVIHTLKPNTLKCICRQGTSEQVATCINRLHDICRVQKHTSAYSKETGCCLTAKVCRSSLRNTYNEKQNEASKAPNVRTVIGIDANHDGRVPVN